MEKQKQYGIDRVVTRWDAGRCFPGTSAQVTLPVTRSTLIKWRREDPATALQKLIKKVGSQKKLAEIIGVAQRTVSVWLQADLPPDEREVPEPRNEVERVVRANGGQPKVGADLGVTQQCVGNWCKLGYVPVSRAQEMEMLYGVSRTILINPKLRNALGAGEEL